MSRTGRRKALSSAFVGFCALSVLLALVPLAFVLFFVISQGILALNVDFFTHMPKPVGELGGALANSIVGTDGYIPDLRAMLCPKEWTQLNYGWWTVLEPHLTDSYKQKASVTRQQARKGLEDENKALAGKLRQMRGQQ